MKKKLNIDELINECKIYTPLDGRIIIWPHKIIKVRQSDYGFEVDKKAKENEGKDPEKHRVKLRKVRPMVNAKYQLATVLQIPLDETRIKVGDVIVYPFGCTNPFDLVKGTALCKKYDIVGIKKDFGIVNDTIYSGKTINDVYDMGFINPRNNDWVSVNENKVPDSQTEVVE